MSLAAEALVSGFEEESVVEESQALVTEPALESKAHQDSALVELATYVDWGQKDDLNQLDLMFLGNVHLKINHHLLIADRLDLSGPLHLGLQLVFRWVLVLHH